MCAAESAAYPAVPTHWLRAHKATACVLLTLYETWCGELSTRRRSPSFHPPWRKSLVARSEKRSAGALCSMPPPPYPELCVAAYHGQRNRARQLLETGSSVFDPQCPMSWISRKAMPGESKSTSQRLQREEYEATIFSSERLRCTRTEYHEEIHGEIALHTACHMGRPEVVRLLLTEDLLQLDVARPHDGLTPLLSACGTNLEHCPLCPADKIDRAECVRLLLDAGASLDPVLCRGSEHSPTSLHFAPGQERGQINPLDAAKRAGNVDCARLIATAMALTHSPAAHRHFPPPARAYAVALLGLGVQVAAAKLPVARQGAFLDVWVACVLPQLVSRDSCTPGPPEDGELEVGARVVICGLAGRPELNGALGEITHPASARTGRLGVQVIQVDRPVAVRRAHLRLCRPPAMLQTLPSD